MMNKKLISIHLNSNNSLNFEEFIFSIIENTTNIDSIDKSNLLKSKSMTSENISYLLTDNNFENLKKIAKEIEGMKDIIKYELEK